MTYQEDIITCYTPAYAKSAEDLKRSAERLGYRFYGYVYKEGANWLDNCNKKAEIILTHLENRGVPTIFMDADTILLQPFPHDDLDREFSALYEGGYLSSSFLFVKPCDRSIALIRSWVDRIKRWPKILDRNHLHAAWAASADKPDTRFLDPSKYLVNSEERGDSQGIIVEHHKGVLTNPDSITSVTRTPTFESLRNQLQGSSIICSGVGPSARMLAGIHSDYFTIGVNDIGRYWHPDFLIVVDSKQSFETQGRWPYIEGTRAGLVFYNESFPLPISHRPVLPVKIQVPSSDEPKLRVDGGRVLPCFRTSVHSAAVMAYYFGATNIGIIGADFLPGHPSHEALSKIDDYFEGLYWTFRTAGVNLSNLSTVSKLTSLPIERLDSFQTKTDWTRGLVRQLASVTPSDNDLAEMGRNA